MKPLGNYLKHLISGMKNCIFLLVILLNSFSTFSQEIIPLYKEYVPNSKINTILETGAEKGLLRGINSPTLEYIKPENPNGTAIIVIAGGGYGVIVYNGEGVNIGKELAKKGISAFVLKYRLPNDELMIDKKIGPLQDVQQSIKYLRENAGKYGIDTNKIGVMGFSAGGHLASTAATHFEKSFVANEEHTSLRPDFQVLIYPVISMQDALTHGGSRDNLLGKNPSKEEKDDFSNELQVRANTPPTWITHAADDKVVDFDNSISYFETLRKNKVDVEMHIYPKGDHGFIFRHKDWMNPLWAWFLINGFVK